MSGHATFNASRTRSRITSTRGVGYSEKMKFRVEQSTATGNDWRETRPFARRWRAATRRRDVSLNRGKREIFDEINATSSSSSLWNRRAVTRSNACRSWLLNYAVRMSASQRDFRWPADWLRRLKRSNWNPIVPFFIKLSKKRCPCRVRGRARPRNLVDSLQQICKSPKLGSRAWK